MPRPIPRIPTHRVAPRRLHPIYQRCHPLPQQVEHLQPHVPIHRQFIRNQGPRIKRIRIVLAQPKPVRQRPQCQREPPRRIRGRSDPPAQIGQIKQRDLRSGRRFPRRQTHLPLNPRPRASPNAQQQSNETCDDDLHSDHSFSVRYTIVTARLPRIEGILPSSRAGRPRSRTQREYQKRHTQSKCRVLSLFRSGRYVVVLLRVLRP